MSQKPSLNTLIILTLIWVAAFVAVAYYNLQYSILYVFPFCFFLALFYGNLYRKHDLSHLRSSDLWTPLMAALVVMVISVAIICVVYQIEFILMLILGDIALMFSVALQLSNRIKILGNPSKKWFLAATMIMIILHVGFLLIVGAYNSSAPLYFGPLLIITIYSSSLQALPN